MLTVLDLMMMLMKMMIIIMLMSVFLEHLSM